MKAPTSPLRFCEVTLQRSRVGIVGHITDFAADIKAAVKSISVSSDPAELRSYYLALVDMPRG